MPIDGRHPIAEVCRTVPELHSVSSARELPGGLTNANYKVLTAERAYVVRRWDESTGLLSIDRDNEYENSLRAAQVGVGAGVVAYLPELRALVLEFIDGETMSAARLRALTSMDAVADACRLLHGARRFRDDFDMFAVQRGYLEIVRDRRFRLPPRYEDFAGHVEAIAEALTVRQEHRVPCHNDLLAENFMLADGRFRLIDYEYSGNNEPCFELGNLWSESELSPAQLQTLVSAYFGRSQRHKLARARLWALMSSYGWTLWASIQDATSSIDFDFWSWGMRKYERAVQEFEGPQFDQLLEEARRPD